MDDLKSYIGNAEIFPILKSWDFFQHAGVSPLPHPAAQAMIDYAHQSEARSYLDSGWWPALEQIRAAAADLIHADKTEIAFIRSTAEGISLVANAIDWTRGDVIITTGVEYPTNIYPWMHVAERFGVELKMLPEETDSAGRRSVPLDRILDAAKDPRTKLVALSHVEFASGQRFDLETVGTFCRQRGILFVVDAIQSLGAVPVDVSRMPIDYLSAGGQKWLLSPEGTGIFYCRKELLQKTRPLTLGAMSVVHPMNVDPYDFTLRPDAGRFESGGRNTAGLLAMGESLKMFLKIGTEPIAARIKAIGDRLIAGLEKKGYTIASPRTGDQWSGIVSFTSDEHGAEPIAAKLRTEHRVEIMMRQGRLRASPHFYNTDAQIDRLIELLPGH
jgi:cysteine desulfurase / selenocysteine lyase